MKKPTFFALFVLFVISLSFKPVYAVWETILTPVDKMETTGHVTIGEWLYQDIDGEKVIYFDPNNPPDFIKRGTIVIIRTENGQLRVFEALHDARRGDSGFNPLQPNRNWIRPMLYAEDTAEYRWFHHYDYGDLVIFDGKTYRYIWGIRHNPNTETQRDPYTGRNRWELVSNERETNQWYPHKHYQRGDVVNYRGKTYQSTQDNNSNFEPDNANSPWVEITGGARSVPLNESHLAIEIWQPDYSYQIGDIVLYQDVIYVLNSAESQEKVFEHTDWEQVENMEQALDRSQQLIYQASIKANLLASLPTWNANQVYQIGDSIKFEDNIYLLDIPESVGDRPSSDSSIWIKLTDIENYQRLKNYLLNQSMDMTDLNQSMDMTDESESTIELESETETTDSERNELREKETDESIDSDSISSSENESNLMMDQENNSELDQQIRSESTE